eukprot:1827580-Prymnesium_polylepis.1
MMLFSRMSLRLQCCSFSRMATSASSPWGGMAKSASVRHLSEMRWCGNFGEEKTRRNCCFMKPTSRSSLGRNASSSCSVSAPRLTEFAPSCATAPGAMCTGVDGRWAIDSSAGDSSSPYDTSASYATTRWSGRLCFALVELETAFFSSSSTSRLRSALRAKVLRRWAAPNSAGKACPSGGSRRKSTSDAAVPGCNLQGRWQGAAAPVCRSAHRASVACMPCSPGEWHTQSVPRSTLAAAGRQGWRQRCRRGESTGPHPPGECGNLTGNSGCSRPPPSSAVSRGNRSWELCGGTRKGCPVQEGAATPSGKATGCPS